MPGPATKLGALQYALEHSEKKTSIQSIFARTPACNRWLGIFGRYAHEATRPHLFGKPGDTRRGRHRLPVRVRTLPPRITTCKRIRAAWRGSRTCSFRGGGGRRSSGNQARAPLSQTNNLDMFAMGVWTAVIEAIGSGLHPQHIMRLSRWDNGNTVMGTCLRMSI